jgi:hypothetical protein
MDIVVWLRSLGLGQYEAVFYVWFTGGFDSLDLKEAKALLDQLHA